ncbi:DUF1206 domain-containing protein [Gordonia otitidis]|uniref:DUF1206 domain-containing protein n=1 Tax=Gordonia otitidis (strain DSM 44809 / CCUG 52243 / JCM 12355 / NBRC 100426 / IFM 10032) TaxID=1108044 RepID=H5TTH1_GORO1|nr:DUF1206 domain-containing protein [Gordonia otitidis]GAB36779.1 hypothetical protein GOOTI_239_00260 [Gordonia otitidis NBRC 100426]
MVSGLLHLLIAYIVLRLAFGDAGNADQSGALGIFASSQGGRIVLWLAVIAFVAMALWRVAEVILGPHPANPKEGEDDGWFDRAQAGALAVVYFAFAWTAAQFALGHGQSSGKQNAGLSARLMGSGHGKFVLVVAGLVIIGVGIYHVYKGVTRAFFDDLTIDENAAVQITGIVGYTAKGIVLAGAGILVIVAAVTADPSKATGIDGAMKTVAGWPAGQFLLVIAALGLAAYGIYCFVMARYARM